MKPLVAWTCLLTSFLVISGCTSSENEYGRNRNFWKQLNQKIPPPLTVQPTLADRYAMVKLEPVPGKPLSQQEQLQLVKAQAYMTLCAKPNISTAVLADSAAQLDKLYPTLPPIGEQETIKSLLENPVDEIGLFSGLYAFESKGAVALNRYLDPYLQDLMPRAPIQPADGYYTNISSYKNVNYLYRLNEIVFCMEDRGNYSGWLRTAMWYYRRSGFMGSHVGAFQFSGTTEHKGRLWVIWTIKEKNITRYTTMWNDRFEVWINGRIDQTILDEAEQVFNIGWLNAYQGPAAAP